MDWSLGMAIPIGEYDDEVGGSEEYELGLVKRVLSGGERGRGGGEWATEGKPSYICKIVEVIVEMFEAVDGSSYFTSRWYYKAEDSVMQKCHNLIEKNVADDGIGGDNDSDEAYGEDEEQTELIRKQHKKVFANLEPEVKVPANQDQNYVVEPQTTLQEAVELLRRLTEEVRKNQLANYKSNGEEFKDADADSNNNFENLFGNLEDSKH
ncbi:hypothetical protein SO802_006180 [Lithocarpus litseifolius]|uniref:BAH domain-containing protein n=1 Tax=Lithocarpus litseifolius TaxID=425828 RepID=A0AAW2DMQ2_9ROSI